MGEFQCHDVTDSWVSSENMWKGRFGAKFHDSFGSLLNSFHMLWFKLPGYVIFYFLLLYNLFPHTYTYIYIYSDITVLDGVQWVQAWIFPGTHHHQRKLNSILFQSKNTSGRFDTSPHRSVTDEFWCEVKLIPEWFFHTRGFFAPVCSTWKTPNDVVFLVMKVMDLFIWNFWGDAVRDESVPFFGGGNMPHSRYSVHGIYWIIIHYFDIFWPTFGDLILRYCLYSLEVEQQVYPK